MTPEDEQWVRDLVKRNINREEVMFPEKFVTRLLILINVPEELLDEAIEDLDNPDFISKWKQYLPIPI